MLYGISTSYCDQYHCPLILTGHYYQQDQEY